MVETVLLMGLLRVRAKNLTRGNKTYASNEVHELPKLHDRVFHIQQQRS